MTGSLTAVRFLSSEATVGKSGLRLRKLRERRLNFELKREELEVARERQATGEMAADTPGNIVVAKDGIEMRQGQVTALSSRADAAADARREMSFHFPLIRHGTFEDQQIGAASQRNDSRTCIRIARVGEASAAGFQTIPQRAAPCMIHPACRDAVTTRAKRRFAKLLEGQSVRSRLNPSLKCRVELTVQSPQTSWSINCQGLGACPETPRVAKLARRPGLSPGNRSAISQGRLGDPHRKQD